MLSRHATLLFAWLIATFVQNFRWTFIFKLVATKECFCVLSSVHLQLIVLKSWKIRIEVASHRSCWFFKNLDTSILIGCHELFSFFNSLQQSMISVKLVVWHELIRFYLSFEIVLLSARLDWFCQQLSSNLIQKVLIIVCFWATIPHHVSLQSKCMCLVANNFWQSDIKFGIFFRILKMRHRQVFIVQDIPQLFL